MSLIQDNIYLNVNCIFKIYLQPFQKIFRAAAGRIRNFETDCVVFTSGYWISSRNHTDFLAILLIGFDLVTKNFSVNTDACLFISSYSFIRWQQLVLVDARAIFLSNTLAFVIFHQIGLFTINKIFNWIFQITKFKNLSIFRIIILML